MSSLALFQSALTAELASQGLSLELLWGGADTPTIRRVKIAALHTLLALYPPLRADAGTVVFLQTAHKSGREVLDGALALASAHLDLMQQVRDARCR
jgi:hypothetical protein